MKNKLLILLSLFIISCSDPILYKDEYTIVDTIYVSKNGFNMILGYEVIVEIDSLYHFGYINNKGELIEVNPRKIKKLNYYKK